MMKNIVIRQQFEIEYNTDIDEDIYSVSENEVIENIEIDDDEIQSELLEYLKSQNIEDNWGILCEDIKELSYTTDFDNSIILIDMYADTELSDKEIVATLEGFMEEYFSDKIYGSFTLNIEPIESEPYEYDYNPLKDEIIYNTTTIDSIEVNYNLKLVGNEIINISNFT